MDYIDGKFVAVGSIESQPGSFLEACFALTFAMYVSFLGTSSPEARSVCWALVVMSPYGLGSRDASSRFDRDRRSRQLAAGWQTKGADIHFMPHNLVSVDVLPEFPVAIAVVACDNAEWV